MSAPLRPYNLGSNCAKCDCEQIVVVYHEIGMAGSPCWPAIGVEDRIFVPHLCKRCTRCGYGWCEATADAYPEKDPEEDSVSIRKTASGQVTGAEIPEGMAGVIKTAQLSPTIDPAWQAEDEAELVAENDDQ